MTVGNPEALQQSLELAAGCLVAGNPPFGAVLMLGDEVVATGMNVTITEQNPLRHAELEALTQYYASTALRNRSHVGRPLVMFCSTEPCLMCMGALYWARVDKVVFAGSQEDLCRFRGFGVYLTMKEVQLKFPGLDLVGPLSPDRAQAQWESYFGDAGLKHLERVDA